MKAWPVSGIGIGDIVLQAAKYFLECHRSKFTLLHCWQDIKGFPKWKEIYNGFKKGAKVLGECRVILVRFMAGGAISRW